MQYPLACTTPIVGKRKVFVEHFIAPEAGNHEVINVVWLPLGKRSIHKHSLQKEDWSISINDLSMT